MKVTWRRCTLHFFNERTCLSCHSDALRADGGDVLRETIFTDTRKREDDSALFSNTVPLRKCGRSSQTRHAVQVLTGPSTQLSLETLSDE